MSKKRFECYERIDEVNFFGGKSPEELGLTNDSDDEEEKGIFEGGDELTVEDMCIIDILEGNL